MWANEPSSEPLWALALLIGAIPTGILTFDQYGSSREAARRSRSTLRAPESLRMQECVAGICFTRTSCRPIRHRSVEQVEDENVLNIFLQAAFSLSDFSQVDNPLGPSTFAHGDRADRIFGCAWGNKGVEPSPSQHHTHIATALAGRDRLADQTGQISSARSS